jgi:hypothetical protein
MNHPVATNDYNALTNLHTLHITTAQSSQLVLSSLIVVR